MTEHSIGTGGIDRIVLSAQLVFTSIVLLVTGVINLSGTSPTHPDVFFAGVFVSFAATGAAVIVPWSRLHAGWASLVPLLDVLAIALMHWGMPETVTGVLWVFPLMQLATALARTALVASLIFAIAANSITALSGLDGDPLQLVPQLFTITLLLVMVSWLPYRAATRMAAQRRLQLKQSAMLAEALQRAQRAVQARDDLVSSVSHELRTPLTSVLGYVDLAADEPLTPAAKNWLDIAQRNGQRLIELITGILDASRDGDDLQVNPTSDVDLGLIARASVESFRPSALSQRLTLDDAGCQSVLVHADANRIRQVIDNLVSNAIKYNRADGTVTVETRAAQTPTGHHTVTVTNTGDAIAADDLTRVFERHFRGSTVRNTSVHGHGLGLSIARQIARSHGGELTLDSSPHGLTVATLSLPASPTPTDRSTSV